MVQTDSKWACWLERNPLLTFGSFDFWESYRQAGKPYSCLLFQFDLAPGKFLKAARKHRARLRNPVMSQEYYLEALYQIR